MSDRRNDSGRPAPLAHEEAWELLPWLVNDTLEPTERHAVERHVQGCLECRGEVERCRSLADQVRTTTVSPSPHPAQLQALLRRIDERETPRRWPQPFAGHPRFVRGALLAQAAVIVVLLLLPFWSSSLTSRRGAYRTLSDPPAAGALAASAPTLPMHQLRVVFRPDASEAQLRQLLLEVRGELVGGPSPLGAYTVAVPASGPGAEPLPRILEHLRADRSVRLAEAVSAGAGR